MAQTLQWLSAGKENVPGWLRTRIVCADASQRTQAPAGDRMLVIGVRDLARDKSRRRVELGQVLAQIEHRSASPQECRR
jgi:hypothetical protein